MFNLQAIDDQHIDDPESSKNWQLDEEHDQPPTMRVPPIPPAKSKNH